MENSVQSDFRSTVQPCFPPRTKPLLRVLRSYTDVAPINDSNVACTYPQQLSRLQLELQSQEQNEIQGAYFGHSACVYYREADDGEVK